LCEATVSRIDAKTLWAAVGCLVGRRWGFVRQPLGVEVGNANEIKESIEVLRGEGPHDVTELTMAFGEAMLKLGHIEGGRERLDRAIESGDALEKFIEVTIAHGGDPKMIEDPLLLPRAQQEGVVAAPYDGYVSQCDALTIGSAGVRLGAGRAKMDDTIDPGVGISVMAKLGDRVSAGDPLAVVRYSDDARWAEQRQQLASAWSGEPDSRLPFRSLSSGVGTPTATSQDSARFRTGIPTPGSCSRRGPSSRLLAG
jgi:pyrimidine-nucleoside phosphorylase